MQERGFYLSWEDVDGAPASAPLSSVASEVRYYDKASGTYRTVTARYAFVI